jgi:hypothetical protein
VHVPPRNARTNIVVPTWPPPEPREDPIPTGRVIFMAGKRVLGKARLDAKGVARLRGAELPPGANVRAFYEGDVTYAPRRSSLIQTYGGRIPTELHLVVHSPRGEVSIDTVLRGMTHRVPRGVIRIYDGDELLTIVDLSSTSSQSKARTIRLGPGVHRIRAFYSGDEHFRSCRSAVVEIKAPGSIGWGD